MNEADFLRLVRGETRGPLASAGRLSLGAASTLYRAGVSLRNAAFDRGWKTIHRAEVPVISIGNLTLGGTGKTPMVEWTARWLRDRGLRVAILSRGYGQSEGMNDEGRVLEENLPDVPHLQGRDRASLAKIAVEELESQILVLDDAFQHRRLARDLDIVMIDALEPFGLDRIFPRGLLREPVSALRRASVVVLSRADLVDDDTRKAIRVEAERRAGPLSWVETRQAPLSLVASGRGEGPLAALAERQVAAFCGIGNPSGFCKTLEKLGVDPVGFRAFSDHHPYSGLDVSDLAAWAASVGADLMLTTQKDLVKLRTPRIGAVPLCALKIGLDVMTGTKVLEQALERILPR